MKVDGKLFSLPVFKRERLLLSEQVNKVKSCEKKKNLVEKDKIL